MWKEKFDALACKWENLIDALSFQGISVDCRDTSVALVGDMIRPGATRFIPKDRSSIAGAAPPLPTGKIADVLSDHDFDNGLYAELKRRLLADVGVIAALEALRPELRVRVDRPVLEMDRSTMIGRVAILIHGGFFNSAVPSQAILREFKARGWIREKAGYVELIKPMTEITEMGFLRVESGSYTAVPDMKITEVKA